MNFNTLFLSALFIPTIVIGMEREKEQLSKFLSQYLLTSTPASDIQGEFSDNDECLTVTLTKKEEITNSYRKKPQANNAQGVILYNLTSRPIYIEVRNAAKTHCAMINDKFDEENSSTHLLKKSMVKIPFMPVFLTYFHTMYFVKRQVTSPYAYFTEVDFSAHGALEMEETSELRTTPNITEHTVKLIPYTPNKKK
jgi:hypothetical protein